MTGYFHCHTLCPYGLAIWVIHVSYMGKPVYIPHWAHMGLVSGPHMDPLWACPNMLDRIGPIWVLYGRAHIGKPVYIAHWAYMGLLSGPRTGPLWACPYWLDPYVHAHTDKPAYIPHWAHSSLLSGFHMGPLWACPYGLAILVGSKCR